MNVCFLYGWGYALQLSDGKLLFRDKSGSKVLDDQHACIELNGEGSLNINALREALRRGVRISIKSKNSRAILDSKPLIVLQLSKFLDDKLRLEAAKLIVQASILNKLYVLRLVGLRDCSQYSKIKELVNTVARCSTTWSLMTVEAEAARNYYEALRIIIPPEYGFNARSRRPPRDPVSASISYLNMLLYSMCIRALRYQGLDERIGFLHEPRMDRASLALDLAEEFKQPLVDSAVIPAFTSKSIKASDFNLSSGRVYLNSRGKRKMLKLFRHRLNLLTPIGRMENLIYLQAAKLGEWILGTRRCYEPFVPTLEV